MSDEATQAAMPAAETTTPAPAETADPTIKIESPAAEPETKTEEPSAKAEPKADDQQDDTGEDGQKKRVPGSQRLKRRLELIEADYLSQQQELETLRREREQTALNKAGAKPGVDREPTEADYNGDWFAYQEARSAWTARQAIRDEFNRVRDEERRSRSEHVQREQQRERLAVYHDYVEEVRERIPDFDKVVATATGMSISKELGDEIMSSDKSALLQYHLAKNPEKVRELNSLSGRELAREIGRLESRVHLPTAKKATEATPPPSEVKGAAAPPVDQRAGPDDMNAYVAWRNKQNAARA